MQVIGGLSMDNTMFNDIWDRIIKNEGNNFNTKTGIEFNYKICKDGVITSMTSYRLTKSDFEKAFDMMPLDGPGKISDIVRGSAYIWAILIDKRIF